MSPELSTAQNSNQLSAHLEEGFDNQYNEHANDLESVDATRAREDIAALLNNPVSAVATEALQSHIEVSRRSPQSEIYFLGQHVVGMRARYDQAHLNLDEDKVKLRQGMFDKAA